MFVGHYGPAYAAKAAKHAIPLWIAFLAVQLLDVIWSILVLLGIEKVRIVPGVVTTYALDLYYMPYTHSLPGAIFWSLVAAAVYRLLRRADGWWAAAIIGAAVFSHWVLDLVVHRPDLALYDNTDKVGLSLWNYPVPAVLLEVAVLFAGMYLYLRTSQAISAVGRYGVVVLGLVMAVIHSVTFLGFPPASGKAFAAWALLAYIGFAASAYWLERGRAPR